LLVQQFRVELFQFVLQHFEFLQMIFAICGDHEQQHSIPFDVTEESMPQPFSFMGAFNDTGKVGHTE
jgi:hypothetical protein